MQVGSSPNFQGTETWSSEGNPVGIGDESPNIQSKAIFVMIYDDSPSKKWGPMFLG